MANNVSDAVAVYGDVSAVVPVEDADHPLKR